jgi:copper homeostasis protein
MEVVEEAVPSLLIEVCVDSVESAVKSVSQPPSMEIAVNLTSDTISAVHGGADRLEVCANLGVGGGTTPSLGLLRSIQKAVKDTVPLMVSWFYSH